MAEVTSVDRSPGIGAATQRRSAIVFGGGLAGIGASTKLARAGWKVTLLEARSSLGGRVFSFRDPQSGRILDNGQHVIVGACTNLIGFLEEIGARRHWHLQPHLDVAVYDREGKLGRLYGSSAPAPLHLLSAFVSYPHLGWLEKIKAVRGVVAMMRQRRDDPDMEDMTFRDWLKGLDQPERVITNLWNVLIEGTLNDNVKDVSASMGLMIVQEGLLNSRYAGNVGYPTAPLDVALGKPAQAHLQKLGVNVVAGCSARCVNSDDKCVVSGVTVSDGSVMRADAYVSAVPFWTLPSLFSGALAESATLARLSHLRTSPIVNVHLLYDRPVMDGAFCYFLESPLQWVFNSTRIFGEEEVDDSQSLSVSISAAWDYVNSERSDLVRQIKHEMCRAFPKTRGATLLDAVVVKQRNSTFRCTPGANRFRPGPRTESPNLFLAGEWTKTGWPSTMESALISGYNAADAVMSYTAPVHSENHSVRPVG